MLSCGGGELEQLSSLTYTSVLPGAQQLVDNLRRYRLVGMAAMVFVDKLERLFFGDAARLVEKRSWSR